MSIDPRRQTGSGQPPGPQAYGQLGNSMKSAAHARETIPLDTPREYTGWLIDIELPTSEEERVRVGAVVKILFDKVGMRRDWGNIWFRLAHDTQELLQQFGTEDTIRNSRHRVVLTTTGVSPRHGTVKIKGDSSQNEHNRKVTITPVMAWADMIHGIVGG